MAKRVIKLLGEPIQNEDDKAAAVITPGMLVDHDANGDLVPHASSAGVAQRWFALEREEMGKDIDATYAIGDTVKVGSFAPGTRVLALIASGENVAQDDDLNSAGDGTLAVSATNRVAVALEAVNNTAGPGMARIRVEVV
jgi:hypothetical protein